MLMLFQNMYSDWCCFQSTLADNIVEAIYRKFCEPHSYATASASGAIRGTNATTSSEQSNVGRPSESCGDGNLMTAEGFTSFLLSSDNMAFSEKQLRVCDDMTRPLCEYFISSSHNVGTFASDHHSLQEG